MVDAYAKKANLTNAKPKIESGQGYFSAEFVL
jgi:hypothetical protein